MGEMRWPGLRKVWPITIVRVPRWSLSGYVGGNGYHGHWCCLHIGPWLILGGAGTYDA